MIALTTILLILIPAIKLALETFKSEPKLNVCIYMFVLGMFGVFLIESGVIK